ncbi:hypothetical protein L6164_010453 [Bauhinia variegata]|uniref:Uncharacterized protein n=1 Tax=Bauhinia variegata TaxID=167791 RepID=A0ACB9PNC7_BAUVA|nr:hypothetical protein L6164_010453 [Bauhinia variegata]
MMELLSPGNDGENSKLDPKPEPQNPNNGENLTAQDQEPLLLYDDIDSTCSTPYVSAPSSPGRGPISGFFYSAPASPMHFAITAASVAHSSSSSSFDHNNSSVPLACEFEFSARFGSNWSGGSGSMSSADELFLNGQIRPMKLSTHLERPQVLAPLLDLEVEDDEDAEVESHVRGRDLRLGDKSLRRRTRSMSPLRNTPLEWSKNENAHGDISLGKEIHKDGSSEMEENERVKIDGLISETTPSVSASSSRSSSAGRSSKRWVFLKDFLYRSKSEGRSNNKFWSTISFSPTKERKPTNQHIQSSVLKDKSINQSNGSSETQKSKEKTQTSSKKVNGKPTNGVGKRRVPPSPHELHYKANRAQTEELRKKTFLPYRQGLLGCLGFSSKGYGATMNGFARALNPVSSR